MKYLHFIVFKVEIFFISHQQYCKQLLTQILWTHAWKRLFQINLEIIDFCQVTWRLSIKFDFFACLQIFVSMNSTWKTNSLFCTKQDSSEIDIRQLQLSDINNTTLEENIICLIPPIGSPIIKTPIQWVLFNINKYWAGALIPPSHLPDINRA